MTVTYTAEVATCRGFGCFLKLLFRWRGSIYKLVWLDLVCFLLIYYVLNVVYRLLLNETQKIIFESIVKYCYAYSNLIPLSFVLGFYVSIVMTRWWNQYTSIPWPDPIAVFVSSTIHGQDERGRVMRRTIMRYVCLCLTMVLGNISPRVKKRFPTLDHLVEAGLLIENEKLIIEELNRKFPRHSKHWLPIVWAASIVTRARKEGRIRDDFAVKTVIDELNKFRGQCGLLISYDTISVPLVYTQVVTLAVYSYFVTSVMGQQWVEKKTVEGHNDVTNMIDLYFPIFTTLQFFFYMGWLKVAESLINPFGEDDDDFEVNWMVDRNLQVAYLIVDEMHHDHPELLKDQYWDSVLPVELPYTVATEQFREEYPLPSTANIEVKTGSEVMPVVPSNMKLNEMIYDDESGGIQFTANSKLRQTSAGSTTSMQSVASTMTRVNTVATALKRLFSKDETSRPNSSYMGDGPVTRLAGSASSTSLHSKFPMAGSMRLTDQVIEEVDEQMTMTSMRGQPDVRPTVQNLFKDISPPSTEGSSVTHSDPMDIPKKPNIMPYMRTMSAMGHVGQPMVVPPKYPGDDDHISVSAPINVRPISSDIDQLMQFDQQQQQPIRQDVTTQDIADDGLISETGPEDDFEKLRLAREQEKIERQKQKITRTISSQPPLPNVGVPLDNESLLEQLELQLEMEKLNNDKNL